MSYKCTACDNIVPPKTTSIRVVVETRKRHYPYRPKVNPGYALRRGFLRRSNKSIDRVDDPGGMGWEIVREALVCKDCASHLDKS